MLYSPCGTQGFEILPYDSGGGEHNEGCRYPPCDAADSFAPDHAAVCERRLGGSHQPGRVLSSADRIYVLYAVGDQHHTGIFQRARRPESHADQYNPEHVCKIPVRVAYDPCHARGLRPAGMGELLRVDRDARIPDSDDRGAVAESAAGEILYSSPFVSPSSRA